MKHAWQTPTAALAGLFLTGMCAMPQAYTISAKPGGVNYIEGQAYLNRQPLAQEALKSKFLAASDTLSTDIGKAEILLTPGVFLRIGENSAVRMISPSLTGTQVEVTRGEVMLEVAGLTKDNNIQIISHGASITIAKNGLYRFNDGDRPTAATIDGKAQVYFGEKRIDLGKGRETVLSENLKAAKFDTKKDDELYAWSNVRSQYNAAVSYQSASAVSAGNHGIGYAYAGYGPGWFWNGAYDTWAWLPGAGACYSPFGWGFYSPGAVAYAPVVTGPVYRGGHWDHGDGNHNGQHGKGHGDWHHHPWIGTSANAPVPVDVNRPPAIGGFASSPSANQAARAAAAQSFADTGFHTATGAPVATFSGRHVSTFPSGSTPRRNWDGTAPLGWSAAQGGGAGADASTAHPNARWSGDPAAGVGWSGGHGGAGESPGRGGQIRGGGWSSGHGGGDGSGRGAHTGGGASWGDGHHAGGDGSHPGGAPSGAGDAHPGPRGR